MALSGLALVGQQEVFSTTKPLAKARVKFALDDSYATGGWTAFSTFLKTVLGTKITIVNVTFPDLSSQGGYLLAWDRSADTLMVYGTGSANKAALTEHDAGAGLSGLTAVECIVEYV